MNDRSSPNPGDDAARRRLTHAATEEEMLPWQRARDLTRCFLYWMPASCFPIPPAQRNWIHEFFDRLAPVLAARFKLRPELFLQMHTVYPALLDTFLRTANDFNPLLGVSRHPGTPLAKGPTEKDIKEILDGKKPYVFAEYTSDYCYWFVDKAEAQQRRLFFGEGGMTMMYLPPDPATKAPELPFTPAMRKHPVFQKIDVDRAHQRTFALLDGFQEKSKKLFGADLEQEPTFQGIRFVLPRLSVEDFFYRPAPEVAGCFELFDAYVAESPQDGGVLLAAKMDLQEELIKLVKDMNDKGLTYPMR